MQPSNLFEFIPSALGLLVVAVLGSFLLLLTMTRLARAIFGVRSSARQANGVRGFLSNFD